MRVFAARGYHLVSLSPLAKGVYSIFLMFVSIGLWTSWEIYVTRIGGALEGPRGTPSVAERYVEARMAALEATGGGPRLDLEGLGGVESSRGDGAGDEDLKAPWVLDVFHQHTFTVSVVFLILAHLFMLTRLHTALAGVVIAVAGVSALAHVLAPVLIHGTGGWLWLMPVSGALMGVSWTAMVAWSLVAIWFGVGAARDSGAA